jgi:hypothetical protein
MFSEYHTLHTSQEGGNIRDEGTVTKSLKDRKRATNQSPKMMMMMMMINVRILRLNLYLTIQA